MPIKQSLVRPAICRDLWSAVHYLQLPKMKSGLKLLPTPPITTSYPLHLLSFSPLLSPQKSLLGVCQAEVNLAVCFQSICYYHHHHHHHPLLPSPLLPPRFFQTGSLCSPGHPWSSFRHPPASVSQVPVKIRGMHYHRWVKASFNSPLHKTNCRWQGVCQTLLHPPWPMIAGYLCIIHHSLTCSAEDAARALWRPVLCSFFLLLLWFLYL